MVRLKRPRREAAEYGVWRDKARQFVTFGEACVNLISWRSGRIYLKDEGGRKKEEKWWIVAQILDWQMKNHFNES
jgi:hypothetical protein